MPFPQTFFVATKHKLTKRYLSQKLPLQSLGSHFPRLRASAEQDVQALFMEMKKKVGKLHIKCV